MRWWLWSNWWRCWLRLNRKDWKELCRVRSFSRRPLNDLRLDRTRKLIQPIAAEYWNSIHRKQPLDQRCNDNTINNESIRNWNLFIPLNGWWIDTIFMGFDIGDWALTATRLGRSTVKWGRDDAGDDGSGCECARNESVFCWRAKNLSA